MTGMALIRARRGLMSRVAEALGKTRGAVAQWDEVPAEHLEKVAEATGFAPRDLRPDLWMLMQRDGCAQPSQATAA